MNPLRSRLAVSSLFFFHGLCFASWGARIPAIQEMHGLSEAALGSVLLSIPVGSFISMPIAPMLVSRFGSKKILLIAICFYAVFLLGLGLAPSLLKLVLALVFYGIASNLVNVSLNTQAIDIENIYGRTIMSAFHGLWSLAGFVGAFIGSLMISTMVSPDKHFAIIMGIVLLGTFISGPFLLKDIPKAERVIAKAFVMPDKSLVLLGVISFLSMFCEGAMFDWSGIYFKKIVGASGGLVAAGYVAFMTTMAGTRFIADGFKVRFGFKKVLRFSGVFIFAGLLLSVIMPTFYPSLIGFLLVGSGVSAIVPLCFSEAGKSKKMSPSAAIASVSTLGFLGFLLGPPLIGWVAGASSLRVSFFLVSLMGLTITFLSSRAPEA